MIIIVNIKGKCRDHITVHIRAAEVAYQVMDSSRREGIVQKLCIESIYQVTGHLVHGKLVPPYPPFPCPRLFYFFHFFNHLQISLTRSVHHSVLVPLVHSSIYQFVNV